jgi:hypothetical protein
MEKKSEKSERLTDSEIEWMRRDGAKAMQELAEMSPMFLDFKKKRDGNDKTKKEQRKNR